MKKYFVLTLLMITTIFGFALTPNVYASPSDYITFQYMTGSAPFVIKGSDSLATVDLYSDNDGWDDRNVDIRGGSGEEYANTITRIHSLYDNFYIKNVTGTVLFTTSSFNYIRVEFSDLDQVWFAKFYVNNSSTVAFTWDTTQPKIKLSFSGLDLAPAFSGQEQFVTSIDDAKPVEYFKSYITAFDDTDGDISDDIYISGDQYTPNKSVLGTYEVEFTVEDSNGNEASLIVFITVADVTKPVITGNSSKVQISYTQTFNISTFKTTLLVTDNYHTMNNSNINIESDQYSTNKTNLGTYNIVFSATDPSGNKGTFTKQIEVIDDIAPIINGPTTITKPTTSILTVAEIKAQLTANDAKEGNKTSSITIKEDNYTGKGNKVGSHTVIFSVKDSKGNESLHTVTVTVKDNIPPVWYIQDGVSIKVVPPATLTQQQIIDLLVATGQLTVGSTTQVNYLVNEYDGNEKTPGVYVVSLGYSDTAGNEGVINLAITVLDGEEEEPITIEPETNLFNDIWTWVQSHPFESVLYGLSGLLALVLVFSLVFNKKPRRRY